MRARDGVVIALASEGDEEVAALADHVIYLPETTPLLMPLLTVIPLQLLAHCGCGVSRLRCGPAAAQHGNAQ